MINTTKYILRITYHVPNNFFVGVDPNQTPSGDQDKPLFHLHAGQRRVAILLSETVRLHRRSGARMPTAAVTDRVSSRGGD